MPLSEAPSSSGRRHLSIYDAAKLDGIVIAKTGQTRIQDRVWTGFHSKSLGLEATNLRTTDDCGRRRESTGLTGRHRDCLVSAYVS